ncbi:hypothetical protein PG994_003610 [Apiospora phragmitis]|uniref:Uncharacterized protein n=1 Tax=Apiospora phragmitis TaxID=2905665 RepID=A0ABR1W2G9_9PEZI
MPATPSNPRPRPLIHINGYPGVGKHTVARALQTLLAAHALPARLVANHLLIDAANAVLPRAERGYHALRRSLRLVVFEALADGPATRDQVYIFTDSQGTDIVGASTCAEFVVTARHRGCGLVSVVLSCDEGAHLERVLAADRVARGGRMVDASLAKTIREKSRIYRFSELAAEGGTLEVDVTSLSPEEAAMKIFRHVLDACPELGSDVGSAAQAK